MRGRIINDSNYTDCSVCGITWIRHNRDLTVRDLMVNYRSLHKIRDGRLADTEQSEKKKMLKKCRKDFPLAEMIVFYRRGNWYLQIRDIIRRLGGSRIKIRSSISGKNRFLFRLRRPKTKEEVLNVINEALKTGKCQDADHKQKRITDYFK